MTNECDITFSMEVLPIRYAQNVTAVINTTPGATDDEAICNEKYGFLAPSLSILLLTVCVFIFLILRTKLELLV